MLHRFTPLKQFIVAVKQFLIETEKYHKYINMPTHFFLLDCWLFRAKIYFEIFTRCQYLLSMNKNNQD